MNLFLDTSAIIKIYHIEKGTKGLTKYLSEITGQLIISISDISKIEIHSALLKKFRNKEITYKNLVKVFELLDKDFQC